jgi:hypothetical protein
VPVNAPAPQPPVSVPWVDPPGTPSQAFRQYFPTLDTAVRVLIAAFNAVTAAWTSYTPTIGSTVGAIGSGSATGRFVQVGKTVHFAVKVTITTIGTASGQLTFTLPKTPNTQAAGAGVETAVNGRMLSVTISAANATAASQTYDNVTSLWVNGSVFFFSGTYEST